MAWEGMRLRDDNPVFPVTLVFFLPWFLLSFLMIAPWGIISIILLGVLMVLLLLAARWSYVVAAIQDDNPPFWAFITVATLGLAMIVLLARAPQCGPLSWRAMREAALPPEYR